MSPTPRADGRAPDELRPVTFERDATEFALGSVMASSGRTKVLCTVSLDEDVPRWMRGRGSGWVTAEYSMLPGSSPERIRRETKGPKGRTQEIQRLIGRSLRAVVDHEALGERQLLVDCDVLQADGGTRTTSITGAWLALWDACERLVAAGLVPANPILQPLAALSVGLVDGEARLDLPYEEDSRAEVDMNVVVAGDGRFVEVQGTAEGQPFSRNQLDELMVLAEGGAATLFDLQRSYTATPPEPRTIGRSD
ncbi:MAG: ribonuclease PH [Candidatus Microthrix subdominans]|jgi:ribonuclease PH|uniref:Ribonuclease PH n=1 Tax=Candidatus Neomicrothrix subdominans TaxID=2954438 RepID=A0A936NAL2_9ACTN|nr:ribonuclease PH [Candidatus Microthrix sp.]MBK9296154.1 ribonuclease PH [Candidatus Microthrix subdominans]MBK6311754.1 ribonuclease PH [Candidatus Microthrix sp.]MBK6968486.1 ribonuclease PH [Candidatus Microthrix sp.]MBK7164797.1 ribonuclease PH [Candidatus Microthrix sp.]MBP7595713.1 ribonuclease PH [Candidatus Microthrix sp.]